MARCTPLLLVSGSRIKAECCLTGDVLFVDDNIIENLATKLSANFAAADGVAYSSTASGVYF